MLWDLQSDHYVSAWEASVPKVSQGIVVVRSVGCRYGCVYNKLCILRSITPLKIQFLSNQRVRGMIFNS